MALEPVPLPLGLRSVKSLPRSKEVLINLIPGAGLLSRPGTTDFATGSNPCRGGFFFKGRQYFISGTDLTEVTPAGQSFVVGQIPGDGYCGIAVDHAQVAIVDGRGFVFDGVSVIENTNAYYEASSDVEQINGTFVYSPVDGGPAFFSTVGDADDILAENFFDAEAQPDFNTGLMKLSEDFYIAGEDSIELFRYTGTTAAPLRRVLGGQINIGYIGGKVEYSQALGFLGVDDGPHFYLMQEATAQVISTEVVDEMLAEHTFDELKQCVGSRFVWQGQDVLVFKLPKYTFGYNGEWFLLASGDENSTWRVNCIQYAYGKHLCGDSLSGVIGVLNSSKTEFGSQFQREMTTFFRAPRDSNFSVSYLEVETVSRGAAGTLGLSLSQDGVVYGVEGRRNIPKAGDYTSRVLFNYPGGLGSFESFMGIRLRTAENVDFNVDALWVEYGN